MLRWDGHKNKGAIHRRAEGNGSMHMELINECCFSEPIQTQTKNCSCNFPILFSVTPFVNLSSRLLLHACTTLLRITQSKVAPSYKCCEPHHNWGMDGMSRFYNEPRPLNLVFLLLCLNQPFHPTSCHSSGTKSPHDFPNRNKKKHGYITLSITECSGLHFYLVN